IRAAGGGNSDLDRATKDLESLLADPATVHDAAGARWTVQRLATALQASLLVRYAPTAVSDAFVRTRVLGQGGSTFGALPPGVDVQAVVGRALPG
ncbi:MAG TPA: DNA alkylation response protein, partial [Pedococcus sp.]|nr:DNA alkylation response protein [Pedococcus sp.]